MINLNNAKKAKYINTDGTHELMISDAKIVVRYATKILSLKCKNENDELYKKEFSLSEEGISYFVDFLNRTKLLTDPTARENFKPELLLGAMFTTKFGKKANKKYNPNVPTSRAYYVYELPDSETPYSPAS